MDFKKTVELMQQLADDFRSNAQLFEEMVSALWSADAEVYRTISRKTIEQTLDRWGSSCPV